MSQALVEQIAKPSKHKRIQGTILEAHNGTCTISYGGSRLFGVKIIGGIPTAGEEVFIDWNGYEPVVTKAETGISSGYQIIGRSGGNTNNPQTDPFSLGGWTIDTSTHVLAHDSGNIRIDPRKPSIELGAAVGFENGVGIWMGKDSSVYKLHIGDPAAQHISWNGNTLDVIGLISGVITETSSVHIHH